MEKKFKIILPERAIASEKIEKMNKAMFTEDIENKGGILSKSFIFCYLNQPATVTEITKKINEYYGTEIDRVVIFRNLQKLNDKLIVFRTDSGEVLSMAEFDNNEIYKRITLKYHAFIKNIPEAFRKRFHNVNYFWVSNGEGYKYLEWCCKLLNFKYEEEK